MIKYRNAVKNAATCKYCHCSARTYLSKNANIFILFLEKLDKAQVYTIIPNY